MNLKRIFKVALAAVAAGILLVVIAIRSVENRLIYFPPRYPEGFPSARIVDQEVKEVWLTTEDGVRINAYYRLSPEYSKQVLLWFHGNAENIGSGLDHQRRLAKIGVNVMAVDYRGYGKSEGTPDEAGVYHDADAAYNYLIKQRHFRPVDIFVYGHSLGGAVAVDLAAHHPCGGLIVESSFTSARAMARRMFRIPLLAYVPKTRFDSLEKIRSVRAPILIIHGTRDEVIPYEMGQQLFAAAPEPKRFYPIEGAGHNDVIEEGGDPYLAILQEFVSVNTKQN